MFIDHDVVDNFVNEYCSNVTYNNNKWHCRCPLCGDSKKSIKKKRFHVLYNNGEPLYNCFNCNSGSSGGSFISLYMTLKGITYKEAFKELFKYNEEKIIKKLTKSQKIKETIKKSKEKHNNYNYILDNCINENSKGIIYNRYNKILQDFKTNRKIPDSIKLFICFNGYFKDRIIIPIYDNNNDIIYFQGRSFKENVDPKYLMPNDEKSSIILNEHKFDRDKSIIVTEGLIDAFMVGDNGTSCLGSTMKEEFIKRLLELTDKDVILFFDNDKTGKKSLVNFLEKNSLKNKVKYFVFPNLYKKHKDLNEIIVHNNINSVYDFVVNNSYNLFTTKVKISI